MGWLIVLGILTYLLFGQIFSTISQISWMLESNSYSEDSLIVDSPLFDLIDSFTPKINPVKSLVQIIVLLAIGHFLNKKAVISLFEVNRNNQIISISIGGGFAILLWAGIIY